MPQRLFIRNTSTDPLDRSTTATCAGADSASVTLPESPVTFPNSAVTMPKRPVTMVRNTHLDAQSRLIAFEIVATGTLTEAPVYPREVVLRALAHGAASVVLAHNHPTGQVSPSSADKAMTQTLKAALALVGVRVVDHVIVSARDAFSMADADLIQ